MTAFDHFLEHIRGDTALGALNAADFLTVLVDSVLAGLPGLVESIERRIDALDEVALRTSDADAFLREVVVLRRRIAILRRGLAPIAGRSRRWPARISSWRGWASRGPESWIAWKRRSTRSRTRGSF